MSDSDRSYNSEEEPWEQSDKDDDYDSDAPSDASASSSDDDGLKKRKLINKMEKNKGKEKKETGSSSTRRKKASKPAVASKKSKPKLNLIGIRLNTPIKPMLARATKSYEDAMKRCPNGFLTEVKYDGERIQVHKKGDKFKCFSRNLKPIMEYKVEAVKPYILKSIKADEIIVDGEILMIDNVTGQPLPFGTLGKHKKQQFKDANVAIFFFDVLYLEGKSLLDKPLRKRREILEQNIKVIPNHILLSEFVRCDGTQEEREALLSHSMNNAIAQGLEGLVIKDLESVYEPAARHWLKMKKDYLKGMADSADLVVLGAYYGTGSKGGMMSVFLMGVYDNETKQYKAVCKVGNGHDDATIMRLNVELEPNMKKISKDYSLLPDWLDCDRPQVPDFVCKDPLKSVVWEVVGAELNTSTHHMWKTKDGGLQESISIRFPRVTRIRDDKSVKQATTLKELQQLYKDSKKKGPVSIMAHAPKMIEREEYAKDIEKFSKKRGKDNSDSDDENNNNNSRNSKKPRKKASESDSDTEKTNKEEEEEEMEDEAESSDENLDELGLHFVYGEFTEPITVGTAKTENKVLCHSVDNSGKWASRGAMRAVSTTFGDVAKDAYEMWFKSGGGHLGEIQTVPASVDNDDDDFSKWWVCNMVCQQKTKGGAPPIDYPALEAALKKLRDFAKEKKAVVHFSKFHSSVPMLQWRRIQNMIKRILVEEGIKTVVYTRDPDDKARCKVSKERLADIRKRTSASAKPSAVEATNPADKLVTNNSNNCSVIDINNNNSAKSAHKVKSATVTKTTTRVNLDTQDMDLDLNLSDSDNNSNSKPNNQYQNHNSHSDIARTGSGTSAGVISAGAFNVPPLPDVFTMCKIYLHGFEPAKDKQLRRYIMAYDGTLATTFDEDEMVSHIVADDWDETVEYMALESDSHTKFVKSSWIWDCISAAALRPELPHILKRRKY